MLIAEMVMFMLLIVPLPFTWRRKLFTFISESPIIAKLQYGMKVSDAVVLGMRSLILRPSDMLHRRSHSLYRQREPSLSSSD